MVAIAGKELSTPDLAIVGAGAVMVIDLFVPWYRISFDTGSIPAELRSSISVPDSVNANAFDANFLAWFPALLVIAVAVVVALGIFQGFALPTNAKVGPQLMLAGASGIALVLLVLRWLTENDYTFIGLYLAMLLAAVQGFFGYQKFKASGETIPEIGGHSFGGGTPPPPPSS